MTIPSTIYNWYRQGLASIANGATAVTGTTTAWSTNVKAGDGISFDGGGKWYEVASVTDNTHLTLATAFAETTVSSGTYAIDRRSLAWQVGSETSARLLALMQMLQQTLKTTGQPPDTIGSDGAVAYDATAMVFYTKTGDTWDTGTSFRGSTVLNGAGAPSSGTGNNADFYLDTTNTRLYGPKTGGAWGSYVSLVGPGDALTSNPLSQFAATTSLQLKGVISDETGSGSLVFATSPTLVTPALGTPSSGTLTNCTGLPVSGVSGLATSTTTGRLAKYSNTTGSQEQTVGIFEDASGNSGFGTVSPWAKVSLPFNGKVSLGQSTLYNYSVYKSSAGNLDVYFDSLDTDVNTKVRFRMRTGGTPVDVLTMDGNGNLGLGVSGPAAKIHAETAGAASTQEVARLLNPSSASGSGVKISLGPSAPTCCATIESAGNPGATYGSYLWLRPMLAAGVQGNGVFIDKTDYVGFGTQNPTERVHAVGRIMATGSGYVSNPVGIVIGQYQAGVSYIQAAAGASLDVWNGGTSTLARFHNGGGVQFPLYGAGTLSTDASGNITASSDEALKDDIQPFTRGLQEILQINPISYLWSAASGLDRMNRYTGFSAQNVETAIPEAVGVDANGYLTLIEKPILAALVNAVKTLNGQNAALAARIAALEQGA